MSLGQAASCVVSDLATGTDPNPRALAIVLRQLRRRIARSFPALDADDVVQSTVIRLMSRSERLRDVQAESAWSYLLAAARNSALDAIRTRKRRQEVQVDVLPDQTQSADDAVAGLIDRDATNARVLAALRAGIEAGDDLTVPIITTWLDLADELDRAPSTREVASRAGVSHTTVAQALKRFRAVLQEQT